MLPPFRREGPLQLDPIWREARELGVENEYGSMLAPTWDPTPMPQPRQGTWANTPDHYFRYHSSRELQFPWRSSNDDLPMSPEPSERDTENCLMDTPDCKCRWLLLDSLQNPVGSGQLSYDPSETDLSRLPFTPRPPGYVCSGRDPNKHIRISSASLQGFVTPRLPQPGEGSSRTFFAPEEENPNPNNASLLDRPGEYRTMRDIDDNEDDAEPVKDYDAEFEDILGALEILSGQTFDKPNQNLAAQNVDTELDWNDNEERVPEPWNLGPTQAPRDIENNQELHPEPPGANPIEHQVENVEVDSGPELRRARPGQNRLDATRNQYLGDSDDENVWDSPGILRSGGPEDDSQRSTAGQEEDAQMLDATQAELLDYDEEVGAPSNWAPRSGDVMILKHCRYIVPWPGFDGKVEFYVDENEHNRNPTDPWTCWFEDGDIIVRFGSYSSKWQWTQAPQVRVYQFREGKFFLVGRQTKQPLYPMEYKGIRFPYVWYIYWWDEGMPVRPSDLLVRAAFDEDENFSYCDAEVYLRNPNPAFQDNWVFLGKDDYSFKIVTDQFASDDNQPDP
ncbi:hypothetical protein R1sor_013136 [Riccia sorocarpa]|uniref:Uncharacterized protein n=1 Tax=Riccia sorocarpa TaxID=122646 RepID=A0ABD3H8D1_9MARC